MSSAAAVLGSVRFAQDRSTRASNDVAWDTKREAIVVAAAVAQFMEVPKRPRPTVVELTPRNFTQTATHFKSVTTKVEWPTDEHDID
jgi:hypothetical protein